MVSCPSSSDTLFTLMVDWCLFDCVLEYFPTLFFRLCQENYVFVLGWGAENVAHSCPHWTGIPTPLVLGVGAKYARVAWLVTFVLVGLRCSGNFSPRKEHIRNVKDHALQVLFPCVGGCALRGNFFGSSAAWDFLLFFFPPFRGAG